MDSQTETHPKPERVGENEAVVRSPVEVRPGLRGTPVLWVLIASSILAVIGMGYFLFAY